MLRIEEDFELELRSLPGVLNVGFERDEDGGVTTVTLVTNAPNREEITTVAQQISALYYPEAHVVVDDVNRLTEATLGGRGGARAALVRAECDAQGVCEVVLNFAGRLATGRAPSGPLIGGVEATLGALRQLGFEIPFTLLSVSHMIAVRNWPVVVVLRSTQGGADRFGIAQSDHDVLAASRATLSALNRLPMSAHNNGATH
ncbi:MAG: hypothetical protein ACYCRG_00855 [Acidimicrobiales bacterium]